MADRVSSPVKVPCCLTVVLLISRCPSGKLMYLTATIFFTRILFYFVACLHFTDVSMLYILAFKPKTFLPDLKNARTQTYANVYLLCFHPQSSVCIPQSIVSWLIHVWLMIFRFIDNLLYFSVVIMFFWLLSCSHTHLLSLFVHATTDFIFMLRI